MPNRNLHVPRVILENSDKLRSRRMRPLRNFKIWKILKGDIVEVMEGKSAGERGKVMGVNRKKNTVLVDQVNLVKKHMRNTPENKGGIFTQSAPIHYSNVALIDPTDGNATKTRWEIREGEKVRVSKRSGEIIPKPEGWRKPYPTTGPRDTSPEDAMEVTYEIPYYTKEIDLLVSELSGMNLPTPRAVEDEEENTLQKE